jgi:two-component system, chemotaxis family, sensor kinase CheA
MDFPTQVDDEDVQAFLVEGQEILSEMEQSILGFETSSSTDPQQINQLYRGLHTLKGNCGFLPFPILESIAHSGETLLDTLRSTQQNFTSEITAALLQAIDSIRTIFQTIQSTGKEGSETYSALIAQLEWLSQSGNSVEKTRAVEKPSPDALSPDAESSVLSDSTIRVPIELLDRLMNLVGELVLARNRMFQLASVNDDATLLATSQHIDSVTNELQASVMQSRMQPLRTLWRSLPRMVRDLSLSCGKSVQLELEGEDTELDRSLVAALKDPLAHLIRNCIDHGIERPEVRTAIGKPAQGILKLRAFQESGKVNLELYDDGQGIDPTHLKLRAQQLGLINATDPLSDREALELMFLPGFSTNTEVTRLSGRGVGLDVVRRNLEAINGTVTVESEVGRGSTFRLKIPLTLAIISTLLISSGEERFVIPQTSVQELVRIEGKDVIERSVEYLLGAPVYRLRGQILPLINLNQVLGLPAESAQAELLHIVVITADRYRFGLIVDTIEDTQEIVVKPLTKQLRSLSLFSGATILGDGTVSLILDVIGLAQQAEVNEQQAVLETAIEDEERQLVLLVQASQGSPMGILMNQATRLETIPLTQIEPVGGQYLIQYRDRIVPLIDLPALMNGKTRLLTSLNPEIQDPLPVVVMTLENDRIVGLVVDAIVDIVEESLGVVSLASRPGVQYYATVRGQITEILDLTEIINLANPHPSKQEAALIR